MPVERRSKSETVVAPLDSSNSDVSSARVDIYGPVVPLPLPIAVVAVVVVSVEVAGLTWASSGSSSDGVEQTELDGLTDWLTDWLFALHIPPALTTVWLARRAAWHQLAAAVTQSIEEQAPSDWGSHCHSVNYPTVGLSTLQLKVAAIQARTYEWSGPYKHVGWHRYSRNSYQYNHHQRQLRDR